MEVSHRCSEMVWRLTSEKIQDRMLLEYQCCRHWAQPTRLSAGLAEGVVYDLGAITLERSGFHLCVYKPPIAINSLGVPSTSRLIFRQTTPRGRRPWSRL